MRKLEKQWFDMLKQVVKFSKIYANYTVSMRYGHTLFKNLSKLMPELERYFTRQLLQPEKENQTILKATVYFAILRVLDRLSETLWSFEEDIPGISSDMINIPFKMSDQELIDRTMLFIDASPEIKEELFSYSIDETYPQELKILLQLFQEARECLSSATGIQAKNLIHINSCMEEALWIVLRLSVMMENKYSDSYPKILQDWKLYSFAGSSIVLEAD